MSPLWLPVGSDTTCKSSFLKWPSCSSGLSQWCWGQVFRSGLNLFKRVAGPRGQRSFGLNIITWSHDGWSAGLVDYWSACVLVCWFAALMLNQPTGLVLTWGTLVQMCLGHWQQKHQFGLLGWRLKVVKFHRLLLLLHPHLFFCPSIID